MVNKIDTDTQIGRLITLVKTYPILYDESHKDYQDKEKKDLIWTEIGKKMGTNCRMCRRKWYGLMMNYNKRELHGEEAVTDENGKVWPWYGKMQFVRNKHDDIRSVVESIPSSEVSDVVTSLETVEAIPEVKTSSNGMRSDPSTNSKANKLFLESLVEDLSSLNLRDQYEFKKKVLDLMQSYLLKD